MTRRRWAHLLLGLAGLVAIGWAVVWGANPQITCGDVVMGPGDVCAHAGGDKIQTYDERLEAAQGARPVVGVVGLLVVGFATYLWISESTRDEARV
ncbi:MAG: hypothetical protein VB080_06525 [Propionicimonas sp.]|uniref:hypothetical protein n=1 Tax=Propionicimonas sp. TaxID=1955623 RepID=UPI002B1EA661|nr:hypothetical protein [Propionicimonas sp.]MEA4944079.1 hypothetical protein [Propionicimonas sp.]MEA5054951.1 hypothetical protein [Propionicimonas sp.]MEA5116390.1 hypothetical protein [Propionicimonas sp.]